MREKSSTKTLSGLSILMALESQVRPKSVDPKLGVGVVDVDMVLAVGGPPADTEAGLLAAGLNFSTVVDTCAVSSILLVAYSLRVFFLVRRFF